MELFTSALSYLILFNLRQQVSLLAQRLTSAPGNEDSQTPLAPGSSKVGLIFLCSSYLILICYSFLTLILLFQEGEGSNQVQTRPNPPQFGIISMFCISIFSPSKTTPPMLPLPFPLFNILCFLCKHTFRQF